MVQVPALHTRPLGHCTPQAPQLVPLLDRGSTQTLPQHWPTPPPSESGQSTPELERPQVGVTRQAPYWQNLPAPQALPQAPQLV